MDTTYRDFKKPVGSITVCDIVLLIYLKQHETMKHSLNKTPNFNSKFKIFLGLPVILGVPLQPQFDPYLQTMIWTPNVMGYGKTCVGKSPKYLPTLYTSGWCSSGFRTC